jgi:hypothetical protein
MPLFCIHLLNNHKQADGNKDDIDNTTHYRIIAILLHLFIVISHHFPDIFQLLRK